MKANLQNKNVGVEDQLEKDHYNKRLLFHKIILYEDANLHRTIYIYIASASYWAYVKIAEKLDMGFP